MSGKIKPLRRTFSKFDGHVRRVRRISHTLKWFMYMIYVHDVYENFSFFKIIVERRRGPYQSNRWPRLPQWPHGSECSLLEYRITRESRQSSKLDNKCGDSSRTGDGCLVFRHTMAEVNCTVRHPSACIKCLNIEKIDQFFIKKINCFKASFQTCPSAVLSSQNLFLCLFNSYFKNL